MSSVSRIIGFVVLMSIGSFYAVAFLLKVAISLVKKPRNILKKKKRDAPPAVLQGSALGTHHYIQLKSGVKLHYVAAGAEDKPLMVCLHGFPEFWYSWRHQLSHFSSQYRVIAPDLRGYGDSDKPSDVTQYGLSYLLQDVKELIEGLGHKKAIILCHDWGAVLGWALCDYMPDVVEKCVVMNVGHSAAFRKFIRSSWKQFLMSWYMFLFQLPWIPELMCSIDDFKMLVNSFRGKVMGVRSERFTDEDMEAYLYTFAHAGFTGPINWYRANLNPRYAVRPPKPEGRCQVPILLLWGDQDKALSVELAHMSLKCVDNCTLKIVPGASHWVQQDQPDVVNAHVADFLKEK